MEKNKDFTAPLIIGVLFAMAGLVALIGLMTFAVPCDRILDNGMPARCDSLGYMQRGLAVVGIALGVLMIIFRRFAAWLTAFIIMAFLLGIVFMLSADVLSDTCNVRTHEVEVLDAANPYAPAWPERENRQIHRNILETVDIHVVWTNFNCNEGLFTHFATIIGILFTVISAAYAFFIKKTTLSLKISLRSIGSVYIGLGAFAIIALFTFAPPCFGAAGASLMPTTMRCFDVAMHVNSIAAVVIIGGVLMVLFSRSILFRKGLAASICLFSALVTVMPFFTETCFSPTMICNEGPFAIFITVMGAIILAVSLIHLFLLNKAREDEDYEEA